MKKYILFVVIFAIVFCALDYYMATCNPKTIKVLVNDIEKIDIIESSKEEGVHTEIKYIVYTSGGAFYVQLEGFASHPEVLGKIVKGDSCTLTVSGVNFPFARIYPSIIKVE